MIDVIGFKSWLFTTSEYSNATVSNIISRLKRADALLPWFNDEVYIFRLEQNKDYKQLSCSVRSQIKKAVKLYFEFCSFNREKTSK